MTVLFSECQIGAATISGSSGTSQNCHTNVRCPTSHICPGTIQSYDQVMTSERNKAKRWRPRWSVRTLLVATAMFSAYLACWGPTKKRAYQCVNTRGEIDTSVEPWVVVESNPLGTAQIVHNTASPLPLIISQDEVTDDWSESRRYYLWLFGPAFKLPFQRCASKNDRDSWDQALPGGGAGRRCPNRGRATVS